MAMSEEVKVGLPEGQEAAAITGTMYLKSVSRASSSEATSEDLGNDKELALLLVLNLHFQQLHSCTFFFYFFM